ncbi:MAG TPA: hypothetical protein VFT43_02670 [Candidatus Polarisedimenticolia bacterium]|nr:hypothetical protein [Candidatus Polarisedimenticolia bacterium]
MPDRSGAAAAPGPDGKPPAGAKGTGKSAIPKGSPSPTPAAPPEDLLRKLKERDETEAMRKGQVQALRDKIAQLQSRLDYLQAKKAAVLNPLSIMPKGQNEEDQKDASLKPVDLLAKIDEEIKTLTTDLEETKGNLVRVETRFASEAGTR